MSAEGFCAPFQPLPLPLTLPLPLPLPLLLLLLMAVADTHNWMCMHQGNQSFGLELSPCSTLYMIGILPCCVQGLGNCDACLHGVATELC